jgi:hypothetical protein
MYLFADSSSIKKERNKFCLSSTRWQREEWYPYWRNKLSTCASLRRHFNKVKATNRKMFFRRLTPFCNKFTQFLRSWRQKQHGQPLRLFVKVGKWWAVMDSLPIARWELFIVIMTWITLGKEKITSWFSKQRNLWYKICREQCKARK